MKLHEQARTIQRSGDIPQKRFGMEANATAFNILVGNIYNDPIMAIIRELSTNAYDSHVDAGKADVPFDVHLPNALSPEFVIRDYGTGMSPDKIDDIYLNFFNSTRKDSNTFIGAMGLGSKTPFAYTDQFSVTSFWNGERYDYSCFKDEEGCPTGAILNVSETDESNGVEIKIAIRPDDIDTFATVAKKVYTFFDVRPNVNGYKIDIPDPKPIVSGTDFDMYDSGMLYEPLSVIMGQIRYKIDHNRFSHRLHGGRLVLKANIGDVSIAASREELYYDDRTDEWVQDALDRTLDEIEKEFVRRVSHEKSVLSQIQALGQYRNYMKMVAADISIELKTEHFTLHRLWLNRKKLHIGVDDRYISPKFDNRYSFIENDVDGLTQKMKNRLRHFLEKTHFIGHVFLVNIYDTVVFEKTFGKAAYCLSMLPDAPRKKPGEVGTRCSLKQFVSSRRRSECWQNVIELDSVDSCLVPREGYKIIWQNGTIHPNSVADIADEIGFKNIYGVPAKSFEKQQKALGLPSLEDATIKWVNDIVDGWSDVQRLIYHKGRRFGYYHSEPCDELIAKMAGLSNECDDLIEYIALEEPSFGVRAAISLLGIQVPLPTMDNPIEVFFKKYPLVGDQCSSIDMVDEIVAYIKGKEDNGTA
jgi:hypothetical protein